MWLIIYWNASLYHVLYIYHVAGPHTSCYLSPAPPLHQDVPTARWGVSYQSCSDYHHIIILALDNETSVDVCHHIVDCHLETVKWSSNDIFVFIPWLNVTKVMSYVHVWCYSLCCVHTHDIRGAVSLVEVSPVQCWGCQSVKVSSACTCPGVSVSILGQFTQCR